MMKLRHLFSTAPDHHKMAEGQLEDLKVSILSVQLKREETFAQLGTYDAQIEGMKQSIERLEKYVQEINAEPITHNMSVKLNGG